MTNYDAPGLVLDKRDWGCFFPSWLDDYGLEPDEIRVYLRISRRAGSESKCWESVPNMAKGCLMGQRRVREVISFLIQAKIIAREDRPGKSSLYFLLNERNWASTQELPKIRSEIYPRKNYQEDTPCNTATPSNTDRGLTPCDMDRGINMDRGTPCNIATTPLAILQDEGSPIKAFPIEGNPKYINGKPEKMSVFSEPNSDLLKSEPVAQYSEPIQNILPVLLEDDPPIAEDRSPAQPVEKVEFVKNEITTDEMFALAQERAKYKHPTQKTEDRLRGLDEPVPKYRISWGEGKQFIKPGFLEYLADQMRQWFGKEVKIGTTVMGYVRNLEGDKAYSRLSDIYDEWQEDLARAQQTRELAEKALAEQVAIPPTPVAPGESNSPFAPRTIEDMEAHKAMLAKFREAMRKDAHLFVTKGSRAVSDASEPIASTTQTSYVIPEPPPIPTPPPMPPAEPIQKPISPGETMQRGQGFSPLSQLMPNYNPGQEDEDMADTLAEIQTIRKLKSMSEAEYVALVSEKFGHANTYKLGNEELKTLLKAVKSWNKPTYAEAS